GGRPLTAEKGEARGAGVEERTNVRSRSSPRLPFSPFIRSDRMRTERQLGSVARCGNESPARERSSGAGAEDGGADADDGGALFDRALQVGAHPHRQLREAV